MVAEPSDTPVARPVVGPTVATGVALEVQFAMLVTFAVEPSEYVPVAVSWVEIPTGANAGFGVITNDCSAVGVTVRVVLPDTDPDVAVTTVDPTARDVA